LKQGVRSPHKIIDILLSALTLTQPLTIHIHYDSIPNPIQLSSNSHSGTMSVVGIDFGAKHAVIAAAGRGGVDVILNGNSQRLNP
jgi:hypothetical protein